MLTYREQRTYLIVYHLFGMVVLLQEREELDNVRILSGKRQSGLRIGIGDVKGLTSASNWSPVPSKQSTSVLRRKGSTSGISGGNPFAAAAMLFVLCS